MLFTLLLATPAVAQEVESAPERVPAEPMSYLGADWLERESRVDEEQPEAVLDVLDLRPGMKVADLGAGSGYYARRMARRVSPGGVVWAVDIQPQMLAILERLAAEEGVEGIVPVLATEDDPKLPAGAVERVVIADVYHEIAAPEAVLARLRDSLTPDARVALLEYRADDPSGDHIKPDHRMSVRQVLLEWSAAGFGLLELHEFLPSQHLFIFERSGPGIAHRDLQTAAADGDGLAVSARAGEGEVEITLTSSSTARVVVTAPAGTRFLPGDDRAELLLRRDFYAVVEPRSSVTVRWPALARRWDRRAPRRGRALSLSPATTAEGRLLQGVLAAAQAATYAPAPGSDARAYVPQTLEVEQAAVWMGVEGAAWETIADRLDRADFPAEYAGAFGLVLLAEAGGDPTSVPAWKLRGEIFGSLRVAELAAWYRARR
jgi:SAM-dependent methyltransferase